MFKRNTPQTFFEKTRESIWPSMGIKRTLTYWKQRTKRILHAEGVDRLAKGIACGIAASFFPVPGAQIIMAAGLAYIAKLPIVASVIGTLLVLPIFLPFLFMLDFLIGRRILHQLGFTGWGTEKHFERETSDFDPTWFIDDFETLFIPAMVGFIVFLPIIWAASYMAIRSLLHWLIRHYQEKQP